MDHNPDAYLSMGLTAENVAREYGITREQADESHSRATRRRSPQLPPEKFNDEIVPVEVKTTVIANGANGHAARQKQPRQYCEMDEGPRADTSLEALAKLKPRSTRTARRRPETARR